MSLLAIAYPKIASADFEKIQLCRQQHDSLYYNLVKTHFTLVFPVANIPEDVFLEEIGKLCSGVDKISFVLRCATLNKDSFSDYYHTFLVPDEGYSSIVKLHDKLYDGILQNQLRMDIDYVPHIGIGNSKDPLHCKKLASTWNAQPFSIAGIIDEITVVKYENNSVDPVKNFPLY